MSGGEEKPSSKGVSFSQSTGEKDRRPHFEQRPSFTKQLSKSITTSLSIRQGKRSKKQCCRKECVVVPVLVLVLVSMLRTSVPDLHIVERLPLPENLRMNSSVPQLRPGEILKAQGVKPKYPVLLLPGIVSTGLELWQGQSCASHLFRKRIWGTMSMAQELLTNMDCWVNHMKLDPKTGLDPEDIKIRGAFGLKAADYLLPGFWIWAKVIENLADIGYDSNNMNLVGYDWRLAFYNMEQRDLTMLKMKTEIELLRKSMNNEKVVICTHSMGSNVLFYFLKWVESEKGGKGGDSWVNDNIEGIVSVGGSWLGAPKVYAALMSGEMKDTAALGTGSMIIDNYVPKPLRVKVMRTFHSMLALLPKGGDRIWGNSTFAPDDIGWPYNDTYNIGTTNTNTTTNTTKQPVDKTEFCLSKYGSFGDFLRIERDQEGDDEDEEKEGEEGGEDKGESCKASPPSPSPSPNPSPSPLLSRSNAASYSPTAISSFLSPEILPVEARSLTMSQGIELLKDVAGDNFQKVYSDLYSDEILEREDKTPEQPQEPKDPLEQAKRKQKEKRSHNLKKENGEREWWKRENLEEEATWTNPLAAPFPSAPNLTLYCIYGVKKLTERSYVYEHSRATFFERWRGAYPEKNMDLNTNNDNNDNNDNNNIDPPTNDRTTTTTNNNKAKWKYQSNHGDANGETVRFSMKTWSNCDDQCSRRNGVANSDGDGTVPLVSLGYMCVKGWVDPELPFNPGKAKIVTKEIIDTPGSLRDEAFGLRGGTVSGDHVDIMGNYQMIMDLLLVASGKGEEVKQEIHSSIEEISERVKV